ncbi:MAG: restriction endonuclease [Clostridia bacterium]|nr:restriction endonuclease [Clostridia bacterium]
MGLKNEKKKKDIDKFNSPELNKEGLKIENEELIKNISTFKDILEEYVNLCENDKLNQYLAKFFSKRENLDIFLYKNVDSIAMPSVKINNFGNNYKPLILKEELEKFKELTKHENNEEEDIQIPPLQTFNRFLEYWEIVTIAEKDINLSFDIKSRFILKKQHFSANQFDKGGFECRELRQFYDALVTQGVIEGDKNTEDAFFLLLNERFYNEIKNNYINNFCKKYEFLINEENEKNIIKKLRRENLLIEEITFILFSKEIYKNENMDIASEIYKEKLDLIENQIHAEKYLNDLLKEEKEKDSVSIVDIDVMSGKEFESCVSDLFKNMGYQTKITKASNDQGIDVIAEKNDLKIAIQAKCYNNKVGNHAIMEAVAGMKYYKADKCMVVTNNYFTPSAIKLAKVNKVELWNRDVLIEKIEDLEL